MFKIIYEVNHLKAIWAECRSRSDAEEAKKEAEECGYSKVEIRFVR